MRKAIDKFERDMYTEGVVDMQRLNMKVVRETDSEDSQDNEGDERRSGKKKKRKTKKIASDDEEDINDRQHDED